MRAWKLPLVSAVFLTLLWLLSPGRFVPAPEPGTTEIAYSGAGGPLAGAVGDAVRVFEADSRRAHAADPAHQPVFRVVSGQNATRDPVGDPTRFLVSVAGGVPPDVVLFDRFAVAEWACRDAFLDLTPFLDADRAAGRPDAVRAEDFYEVAWREVDVTNPGTGHRGVFGVPKDVDDRVLYYRKDLLRRAGFVDDQGEARPPRTWEELVDMAVALTERDARGRLTRVGFAPGFGDTSLYQFGYNNGGRFLSPDGRRVTLDDPRLAEALAWVVRLTDRLGGAAAVGAFAANFRTGALDPFLRGQVAMKIDVNGPLSGEVAQFGADLDYGVAPPPVPAARVGDPAAARTWASGWCYAIPTGARHPAAAWELIRFLTGQRAAGIIAESERLTRESQGQLYVPLMHARRDVSEEFFRAYVATNPLVSPKLREGARTCLDLLDGAPIRPVSPVGQLLFNAQRVATESAVRHRQTPTEALAEVNADAQRALDRVLAPPRGRPLSVPWFVAGYVVLLLAAAVAVYRWDTRRGRLAASPYFRAQWAGGWVCASPWIVGFVVFTGGPILFSAVLSFCDYDVLHPPRLIGTGNYLWMFTGDGLFWTALGNTLYMVAGIPLGMAASLGIALLLNLEVRGIALWRTCFYLPSIVPAVASSILWLWIFNPHQGLLNGLLAAFGVHGPNWLLDERTAKPALILMGLWGAGGGMVIWLAGLKGIATTYHEAAALDGATAWKRFRYVTLPLLSPYVFFNAVMALIGTFQIFTQAFVMTQGGPVNSTLFYAYHLFNQAFRYGRMGYAAALGWVLFLIVFALTMLQTRLAERWVHYEGD